MAKNSPIRGSKSRGGVKGMVESRIKKSNVSFESLTAITIGVGRKKRREIAELANL